MKRWPVLLSIFVVAFALRLFLLGHQNYWFDEILTLQTAKVPWSELIQHLGLVESSNPPLYFSLQHFLVALGQSEFWFRFPSALFGAIACVFAALVGEILLGWRRGIVLGLVLAIAPMQIWYSQEARMYALLQLCGSISFWLALRFISESRPADLYGYMIAALATCYSFVYGFFVPIFCVLLTLSLLRSYSRATLTRFFIANATVFALFLPWLIVILTNVHAARGLQFVKGRVFQAFLYVGGVLGFGSTLGPPISELQASGLAAYGQHPIASLILGGAVFLLSAFVLLGLIGLYRSSRLAFSFSLLGLLVFWGGPAAVNFLKPSITNNPRYAILASIPLFTAVVAGFFHRFRLPLLGVLMRVGFAAAILLSLFNYYFVSAFAKIDLRSAALAQSSTLGRGLVVVSPGYLVPVLEHYSQGDLRIYGVTLSGNEGDAVILERLREEVVAEPERFALVYARPDHGDPKRTLLAQISRFSTLEREGDLPGIQTFEFVLKGGGN